MTATRKLTLYGVLQESFKDSSPTSPIYFILSPGANVAADVDNLAIQMNMVKGETYFNVSMGQGQDKVAEELVDRGSREGWWIVLNNVHLMPRWLVTLEKLLEALVDPHEKFRLFLSSDQSKDIPIGTLSRCIKLTNEPPSGLKANLKRAFCSFSRDTIEDSESVTKAILFGLCHFHSVVVQRKKFKCKGYNMMYPFSLGEICTILQFA